MVEVFTVYSPALPCSGWSVDVGCCPDWDDYDPAIQQAAAEYGAFTVWAATGRRFGTCTITTRPCGQTHQNPGVYGYFWSEGMWLPYIFNGVWRNCYCGCAGAGCCNCEPSCQVWLRPPVASIDEVIVDDAVVDPATYRVDEGMWLVRTKDADSSDCWPMFQDYNRDSGENTFYVTYQQGIAVPGLLARAAGELACEWAKSCIGAPCRLPQRVASVARQGVSISMVNIDDLLAKGLTGIFTVDQVIRNFNPFGLVSRVRISSPDSPVNRTTTWP